MFIICFEKFSQKLGQYQKIKKYPPLNLRQVWHKTKEYAAMKIDFRIDWGYQYLYSRRHYHPFYIWDGKLECENGTVTGAWQLDYPVIWFGPGHCAKETKLEAAEWTVPKIIHLDFSLKLA